MDPTSQVGEQLDAPVGKPVLDAQSYTAQRLKHATPQHLHVTSRRCFIGPLPEGWLKSHRKSWYKEQLHLNYSSRAAAFKTDEDISYRRSVTGLDDAPKNRTGRDLPQPLDIENIEEEEEGDSAEATLEEPPAVSIPVAQELEPEAQQENDLGTDGAPPADAPRRKTPRTRSFGLRMRPQSNRGKSKTSVRSAGASSFMTANETLDGPSSPAPGGNQALVESYLERTKSDGGHAVLDDVNSRSSLLPHDENQRLAQDRVTLPVKPPQKRSTSNLLARSRRKSSRSEANATFDGAADEQGRPDQNRATSSGLVRFNLPAEAKQKEQQMKVHLSQMGRRQMLHHIRRGKMRQGEILKMEKMLVMVETTRQDLPDDFEENHSSHIDSTAVEKWQEFVVVCRASATEDAEFSLQLYQTRVIPDVQGTQAKRRYKYEIPLSYKKTKVNMFSALDKTLVTWVPWKKGRMIYIMRPRSAAHSVEWYTFLSKILGWKRVSTLQINVPDLDVSLRLDNPFEQLEASIDEAQASERDEAFAKTLEEERAVANNIIRRSMEVLKSNPEWAEVLDNWTKHHQMGLAWKRYDRLEWVHGQNERKMYGTIAMQRSHELELRPKQHYPTTMRVPGGPALTEPPPVEGFLIRLTSQRGTDQKFGKLFYKRLYFSSHNQFLCFSRPTKAHPPPPPKLPMTTDSRIPTADQIAEKIPIIYGLNPYPLENGQISWLVAADEIREQHDTEAFAEVQRKINTLLDSDGYINLCDVSKIRSMARGSTPADANIDEGSDVDFMEEVPGGQDDDGVTTEVDDDRTFELVIKNGLVVRLQAFNKMTKREWMKRLRELAKYWKARVHADMQLLKSVRKANLQEMRIDEEMEALIGQYAQKWEVTKSVASPELWHMCGISCCRSVTMSGTLFQKPRYHSTFTRYSVILCHGQLILFQNSLRSHTGKVLPSAHHERHSHIDLKDCYIYSGLITEKDLLYRNQTFDSNKPSHTGLPRIYLEDNWTSQDEDTMCCFVLWHNMKKSLLRTDEERAAGGQRMRLRRVSRLGVTGRSIVLKARSRAERDRWVLSIAMEIERLQQDEEIRVVPS